MLQWKGCISGMAVELEIRMEFTRRVLKSAYVEDQGIKE
jgi:hypothetical protein